MDEALRALLVYDQDHPLEALRRVLGGLGIRTLRARSCEEAKAWLENSAPPPLVFTDTVLPDGSWAEVVSLARHCVGGAQVIVVSRVVDVDLYIRVLESHAFDFVVPPFTASDLAHIVRCATWNLSRPDRAPPENAAAIRPTRRQRYYCAPPLDPDSSVGR